MRLGFYPGWVVPAVAALGIVTILALVSLGGLRWFIEASVRARLVAIALAVLIWLRVVPDIMELVYRYPVAVGGIIFFTLAALGAAALGGWRFGATVFGGFLGLGGLAAAVLFYQAWYYGLSAVAIAWGLVFIATRGEEPPEPSLSPRKAWQKRYPKR